MLSLTIPPSLRERDLTKATEGYCRDPAK